MGKFNYREAAARINQVRWETNYPSMEDACWAYQNAIREMMRDVVDVLHDYFDERNLKFARYETRHSYVLTVMDRIVIRCDWVGYGITDEMFEIYIADSKASVADYVEKYCNDPDVFPSKESFAYVADNPEILLQLTGIEYINYIANLYKVPMDTREGRINELADRFGIRDSLGRPMKEYSHGMRQKTMVIAALIHNPPAWILDEPMTGLDPTAAFELKQMMKEHACCSFFHSCS